MLIFGQRRWDRSSGLSAYDMNDIDDIRVEVPLGHIVHIVDIVGLSPANQRSTGCPSGLDSIVNQAS